jgi:hypothetical protein
MTIEVEHEGVMYRFGGSGTDNLLVEGQCETPKAVLTEAQLAYTSLHAAFVRWDDDVG